MEEPTNLQPKTVEELQKELKRLQDEAVKLAVQMLTLQHLIQKKHGDDADGENQIGG